MTGIVHLAGPVVNEDQHCVQCGELLATQGIPRRTGVPFGAYPEGTLVITTQRFQAMDLTVKEPTCGQKE